MSLPITNTVKVLSDIQKLVVDACDLLRSGPLSLFSVGKVLVVLHDIQQLIADAPGAFPELKDLDPAEIGTLSQEAYNSVQAMITGIIGTK